MWYLCAMPRPARPEPYVKTTLRIPIRQKALLEHRARLNSRTFTAELVEAVDRGMGRRDEDEGTPIVLFPGRPVLIGGRGLPCVHRVAAGAYCEVCDDLPSAS